MGAITSITSSASAVSARDALGDRTNDSATSALRPYVSARLLMEAAASFTALSEPIAPLRPTGVAAPTLVPGAMAATGQESNTNAPAEAARAPCGET